ncbi:hypothetical protein THAOC_00178, partial [Thalassiosira oceanica]
GRGPVVLHGVARRAVVVSVAAAALRGRVVEERSFHTPIDNNHLWDSQSMSVGLGPGPVPAWTAAQWGVLEKESPPALLWLLQRHVLGGVEIDVWREKSEREVRKRPCALSLPYPPKVSLAKSLKSPKGRELTSSMNESGLLLGVNQGPRGPPSHPHTGRPSARAGAQPPSCSSQGQDGSCTIGLISPCRAFNDPRAPSPEGFLWRCPAVLGRTEEGSLHAQPAEHRPHAPEVLDDVEAEAHQAIRGVCHRPVPVPVERRVQERGAATRPLAAIHPAPGVISAERLAGATAGGGPEGSGWTDAASTCSSPVARSAPPLRVDARLTAVTVHRTAANARRQPPPRDSAGPRAKAVLLAASALDVPTMPMAADHPQRSKRVRKKIEKPLDEHPVICAPCDTQSAGQLEDRSKRARKKIEKVRDKPADRETIDLALDVKIDEGKNYGRFCRAHK